MSITARPSLVALLLLLAGPAHVAESPPVTESRNTVQAHLDQTIRSFDRRRYDEALATLKEVLPVAEAGEDRALLARALYYAGRSHYFLSDYRTALPLLERALSVSRDVRDRPFEAEVLRGIGRLHKQQGTYADGLRACDQSIAIFDSLGERREAARTWMTVGAIRDLTGEYEQALVAYGKARVGLESVKDDEYYTLFNEIAITYTNLGRYEDALAAHMVSLEGRERSGDSYFIGISHSNIGDAYFALGQFDRAIEHYERCVELCGSAGERRSVAVALGQLARAWMAAAQPQRALGFAERELALTRELDIGHLKAAALRHLGEAYALLDNPDAALRHHAEAVALSREAGALADEASSLAAMANLHLERGRPEQARPFAERALALARQTRAPDLEVEARIACARAARARGETASALAHLQASVAIIDSVRGRVRTDSGKIGYLDTRQTVFHELADLLLDQRRVKEALEIAEAARGRAFSDLLAAQRLPLAPAAVASLAAIREAEAGLRAQEAILPGDEAARAQLAQTRAAAETQLAGKLQALRSAQPELASLVATESLDAREIAAVAARLDATLVEYLVTEHRLLVWLVRPSGEITGTSVEIGRDVLREKVRALHTRLNDPDARELGQPDAVRAMLGELYRWILAPVAARLPRDPQALVYVVPHDVLLLVPFAALVDPQGRYAVLRHTLVSAPSTAVLRYTAMKKQRVMSPDRPHVLALADAAPPEDADFPALPGARAEVWQLSRRYPADRRLALLREQATEANAKRLSAGQTILHFAVHGLVRDDRPWESALILAPGEGEDGWLRVPEIFGLTLRADLVTLSGCSTGLGKISGDGILGLARAFIYAGAASVVVSQWDVRDMSTAYLMDRFYAAIGDGKARALRAAQLATIERYPHPALWAAFVLVGEPR
ncbi:MAG: CHAT domain-containing protein [Gammaproteobacteria bacterium]